MMAIIILMVEFFGSFITGKVSYLTTSTVKASKGFAKEIVYPP